MVVLVLLFLCAFGGYFIFTFIFDLITGYRPEKSHKYIDQSVHHHYHDNRKLTINGDEFTPNGNKSTIDVDS